MLHVLVAEDQPEAELVELERFTGLPTKALHVPGALLRKRLETAYAGVTARYLGAHDDAAPAIRTLDALQADAIASGASDIHLEPCASGGRIRVRVDGVLRASGHLPDELFRQVVSRVKVLASMDISDRRQPQDGRYEIEYGGRAIDARVSSVPTLEGENVVVRLLDVHTHIPTLDELGMPPDIRVRFAAAIHAPHGFVVVCGPTGSGKTTTLYAALAERNVEGQHLCTVEDPIEARLAGATQVQVNAKAGLTFPVALRAFLRQDPNVVMLGEMRDAESAQVGISAALSGALVATTLHASDAPRAVERMTDFGLTRATLASGISGILAQRLVRRLCECCRRFAHPDPLDASSLGLEPDSPVFHGVGCDACAGTGYLGRTGVFEYLGIDERLRSLIAAGDSSGEIARAATLCGYAPMIDHAKHLLEAGVIDLAELRRVLGREEAR